MVIDFHNHFYPDKIAQAAIEKLTTCADIVAYTDGTLSGLSEDLKKSGYDLGVVLPVATAPKQVENINTRAVAVQEQFPNLISFASMHPDYENYKDEIFRIKELGLKGIKLHLLHVLKDTDLAKYYNENAFKICKGLVRIQNS